MKYRAAIFDMDGLMLNTEQFALAAWQTVIAERFGIPDSVDIKKLYQELIGLSIRDARAVARSRLGPDFPAEEAIALEDEYVHQQVANGVPLRRPGLASLLDFLQGHGLPMAVASSTYAEAGLSRLRAAQLMDRFAATVFGDQIAQSKPAPDIYLAAAEQLGVPAAQCLAFEDTVVGVRAAVAAGMQVIQVRDVDVRPLPAGLDNVIVTDSLDEARENLARLFAS